MSQMQNIIPPPQPANQSQQQTQAHQEPQKLDNISKAKSLIWPLKESLAKCMRVAASNIAYNASIDAGIKGADIQPKRFDKCLEDFYATCDQIEINLKVALDCSNLASSSQRYTPFNAVAKPDCSNSGSSSEPYNYSQLISTVKLQVAHAKEIHDSLTEAARTIDNNE